MLSAFLTAAEPDSPKVGRPAAAGLLDRLTRVRFIDRAVDDQSGLIQYRVREYVTTYAATDLNSRFTPEQVDGGLRAIDAARSRRRERSTEDRLRHTVYRYLDEGRLDEAFGAARECVALAAEQTQVLGPVNARAETDEGLALAALAEVTPHEHTVQSHGVDFRPAQVGRHIQRLLRVCHANLTILLWPFVVQ